MTNPASAFQQNYPAIDPATPTGISIGERIALPVAAGVLVFGAATGDLLIAGIGVAFTLFATIAANSRTDRKVRREARTRFPAEDWAEDDPSYSRIASWAIPATWLLGVMLAALVLFLAPEDYLLTCAAIAAGLTAVLMWASLSATLRTRAEKPTENEDTAILQKQA